MHPFVLTVRRTALALLAALLVLSTGSLLAEDPKPAPDIPVAARHQAGHGRRRLGGRRQGGRGTHQRRRPAAL